MLEVVPHRHRIEASGRVKILQVTHAQFDTELFVPPADHGWRDVDPARFPTPVAGFGDEEAGSRADVQETTGLDQLLQSREPTTSRVAM